MQGMDRRHRYQIRNYFTSNWSFSGVNVLIRWRKWRHVYYIRIYRCRVGWQSCLCRQEGPCIRRSRKLFLSKRRWKFWKRRIQRDKWRHRIRWYKWGCRIRCYKWRCRSNAFQCICQAHRWRCLNFRSLQLIRQCWGKWRCGCCLRGRLLWSMRGTDWCFIISLPIHWHGMRWHTNNLSGLRLAQLRLLSDSRCKKRRSKMTTTMWIDLWFWQRMGIGHADSGDSDLRLLANLASLTRPFLKATSHVSFHPSKSSYEASSGLWNLPHINR